METVKAVLAGFIGIRSRADAERFKVNPLHVIILAVVFVVLFILTLRFIVSMVVN